MDKRHTAAVGIWLGAIAFSIISASAAAPPKYVGLQYDEISRMVLAPATAPPPGTFADAYQKILADAPPVSANPAPPPRRGGLFGGLLSGMSGAEQNAQQAAGQMQNSLADGTLARLAYYNGWVRTDNVTANTATIDKCAQHQVIQLDLAHKTYKVADTQGGNTPDCVTPAAPYGRQTNGAPGTEDLAFTSNSVNLGPKTLQGIPTVGSTDTTGMATTNATGSCSNGSFKIQNERYVSKVAVPRRICPLPRGGAPSSPVDMVAQGGCKPNMKGVVSGAYWMRSSDRLEMYNRMTMLSGESAGQFQSVTQRGNVLWLTKPQADALFSIPLDFTQAQ